MRFDRTKLFDGIRPILSTLNQSQVDGINQIFDVAEADATLTSVRDLAYILTTIDVEAGHEWKPIEERGQRSYFNRYEPGTAVGHMLGNTELGDGYLFRGRSLVQVTGRRNYQVLSGPCGVDLVTNPDAILQYPAAWIATHYAMQVGIFTGKKLSDYISDDPNSAPDYFNARKIINPGEIHTKPTLVRAMADNAIKFEIVLNDALQGALKN